MRARIFYFAAHRSIRQKMPRSICERPEDAATIASQLSQLSTADGGGADALSPQAASPTASSRLSRVEDAAFCSDAASCSHGLPLTAGGRYTVRSVLTSVQGPASPEDYTAAWTTAGRCSGARRPPRADRRQRAPSNKQHRPPSTMTDRCWPSTACSTVTAGAAPRGSPRSCCGRREYADGSRASALPAQ